LYVFDSLNLIEEILRRSPFGLITDVDGTISPTAPTPQQAKISPLCQHYLSDLCNRMALIAAISGRPAIEIKDMIKIDGMVYIGNHCLERWSGSRSELTENAQDYSTLIKTVTDELTPLLSIAGIIIENKGVTATVHYRICPEPQSVEREILKAVGALSQSKELRIVRGKMSINILPAADMNKGTATLDLIREYNLQGAIYLGDEITDVDAFKAVHAASRDTDFSGLAIGVVGQETLEEVLTESDFTLNGVSDVEGFLKWMSQDASQPD